MRVEIIRLPALCELIKISPSTIYRKERLGHFPQRFKLGVHSVGWLLSDVEEWVKDRQAISMVNPVLNNRGDK